jgi:hypothetical protein
MRSVLHSLRDPMVVLLLVLMLLSAAQFVFARAGW